MLTGKPPPMTRLRHLLASLLPAAAAAAALAQQQTPPLPPTADPVQLQRQREELERQRQQRKPEATAPKLSAPAPGEPGAGAAGPSFVLKRVDFDPSHLISREQLDAVVAPQLGKPTTFADVRALAQRINALYYAAGHITARAFVPSQKIVDGVLKVRLVEGRLARIELPAQTRLAPDFIVGLIDTPEGALLDVPRIGRRLERLHRGTDTRIGLGFVAAETKEPGLSVAQVQVEEPPSWTLRASLSNEGAESVGREQLSVTGTWNNLLGRTDKLSLLLIGSKGSASANAQYSLPLPGPFLAWGTRLGAGLSHGLTRAVSPGFETVRLDGKSDGANLSLTQPLWISGAWALDGGATLSHTRSATDIADERFSDVRTDSLALSLTLSRQGESSNWLASLVATPASTRAEGVESRSTAHYQLLASGQQLIDENWSVQGRAGLQYSGDVSLPSTLQFQIGGSSSVRGYRSPTASGDKGETLSLEVHRRFMERYDGFAFVDHGATRTEGGATTRLLSAGFGLSWTHPVWSVSATLAAPQRRIEGQDKKPELLVRLSADLDKLWR